MMGRTHAISSAVVWLAVAPVVIHDPGQIIAGTVIAYAAGFGPDVDTPSSTGAKSLGFVGKLLANGLTPSGKHRKHVIRFATRWGGSLGKLLAGGLAHRGASHWLSTWLVLGTITATFTAWWVGFAVTVGGCTATLGDAITVEGSPLLGPFYREPVKLPRIKWRAGGRNRYLGTFRAGKRWENRVMMPAFTVAFGWLVLVRLG